jgi:hypothetical protein
MTTFKKVLILIIIDTFIISLWLYWVKPDQSGIIIGLFLPFVILILCFFISGLISLVNDKLKKALFINSFIAPVIFVILFFS